MAFLSSLSKRDFSTHVTSSLTFRIIRHHRSKSSPFHFTIFQHYQDPLLMNPRLATCNFWSMLYPYSLHAKISSNPMNVSLDKTNLVQQLRFLQLSLISPLSLGTILLLITSLQLNESLASRPFWADSPSYIEGEYLYVVGKGSHAPSIEEGKQQAFVHGQIELMNAARLSEVSAKGLALEARHVYIEKHGEGNVTVYQLLRIPTTKVVEAQLELHDKHAPQKQAFENAHRDIVALEDSLTQQQQGLERQAASMENALASLKTLQSSLTAKAQEVDQQQLEVGNLKSQLEEKITSIGNQIGTMDELRQQLHKITEAQASVLQNLQQMEQELNVKEEEVKQIHQTILDRVEKVSSMACEYVTRGMTPSEVKKILGPPSGEKHLFANERYDTWAYGSAKVSFDAQAVVESVTGCQKGK